MNVRYIPSASTVGAHVIRHEEGVTIITEQTPEGRATALGLLFADERAALACELGGALGLSAWLASPTMTPRTTPVALRSPRFDYSHDDEVRMTG